MQRLLANAVEIVYHDGLGDGISQLAQELTHTREATVSHRVQGIRNKHGSFKLHRKALHPPYTTARAPFLNTHKEKTKETTCILMPPATATS